MDSRDALGGSADFAGAGVQAGMPASLVTLLLLAYLLGRRSSSGFGFGSKVGVILLLMALLPAGAVGYALPYLLQYGTAAKDMLLSSELPELQLSGMDRTLQVLLVAVLAYLAVKAVWWIVSLLLAGLVAYALASWMNLF